MKSVELSSLVLPCELQGRYAGSRAVVRFPTVFLGKGVLLDADVAIEKLAALALHIDLDQRQVTGGEE